MKKYNVTVNGTAYEVTLEAVDASEVKAAPAQAAQAPSPAPAPAPAAAPAAPVSGGKETITNGAAVKKGDVLMILEAMKMENEIMSPCDGTVLSVNVTKGATVETGAVLCVIG